MKKSAFKILFGILYLSLVVIGGQNAYADIISVPAFSADSGVAHLETFRTTVVNVVNGNIQGAGGTGANRNIGAASVAQIDMYDDANPRLRDADLLSIGSDTFSSGTLTQNSFVKSGGTIATSASLSSTITACVYYVNGYRISLGATAETFTATMDTYVDLSQNGVVTLSPVANGATQPSVAANSARIAKVVTDGTTVSAVTDLANRRLPGLTVPSNYRTGLVVSKDSTTTIKVFSGTCEINNTMVNKTSPVTLTLSTAGDWAGGSSLRAASTFGFVGEDASGNLKLHTTAPTHSNYGVSSTDGKKRYATWSATVYRILGWFYMDGAQNIENASNIKEGDVGNSIISNDSTDVVFSSTSYADTAVTHFYSSGGNGMLFSIVSGDPSAGIIEWSNTFNYAGSDLPNSDKSGNFYLSTYNQQLTNIYLHQNVPQSGATYKVRQKLSSNQYTMRERSFVIKEE